MTDIIELAALALLCVLVGAETTVALVLHPATRSAPGHAGISARAFAARRLGAAMPAIYAACCATATIAATRQPPSSAEQGWWALAAACLALTIIGTLRFLVPLNTVIGRANENLDRAKLEDACVRWDRGHAARTALLVVVLIIEMVAAAPRD